MHSNAQWAICFVNYYTSDLLEWQFRQLERIKTTHTFNVYVIDNSKTSEIEKLKSLAIKYGLSDRIEIYPNNDTAKTSSDAHAEGLELILDFVKSEKYMLVQDPDFFWLIRDHLSILNAYIEKDDLVAIGAPYKKKVFNGQPDFPCAFGSVYIKNTINKGDFLIQYDTLSPVEESKDWFNYEFSTDVGYKVRQKLSNRAYISFYQKPANAFRNFFGQHSFESNPVIYFLKKNAIALHLFRGSFPDAPEKITGNQILAGNKSWNQIKIKYASLSYYLGFIPQEILKIIIFLFDFIYLRVPSRADYTVTYQSLQNLYKDNFLTKFKLSKARKIFKKDALDILVNQKAHFKDHESEFYKIFNEIFAKENLENLEFNLKKIYPTEISLAFLIAFKKYINLLDISNFPSFRKFLEKNEDFNLDFDTALYMADMKAQLFRFLIDIYAYNKNCE